MTEIHGQSTGDGWWIDIKRGIDQSYQLQAMPTTAYMQLHNQVYKHCASARPLQFYPNGNMPQPDAFGGRELYNRLESQFYTHLIELRDSANDIHGDDLIRFYKTSWEKYHFSSKVINGFCHYINQYWVKRAQQDNGTNIYDIFTLSMVKWKEVICETFGTRMTRTCLDWIENERKHETIDSNPIKVVIESYIVLGDKLDNIQLGENNPRTLSVYKYYFEILFLQESKQFYICEAAKFTSADSISEYLKQVAQRLTEEEHRVKSYLHSSTLGSLLFILDDVLIRNKLDLIYAGAEILLRNDKNQDLAVLFTLVSRVPGAIEKLKEIVEKHIYLTGLQAIKSIAETARTDVNVYSTKIIEIYNKYISIVHECFGGERSSFIPALDRACSKFINKNAIVEACGTSTKSAELLARYSDTVLKSKKVINDADMTKQLKEIMVVFNYIDDKDAFQNFYRRLLAERLVYELSASIDYEKMMITELKVKCGFFYTSKLQKMIEDMDIQESLRAQYRQYCVENRLRNTVNFSIVVLTTHAWPFTTVFEFTLPLELTSLWTNFTKFYRERHKNRKLTWFHQYARCELHTNFTKTKHILQVSTYQTAILLLYNDSLELTIAEIQDETKLEDEILLEIICILIQSGNRSHNETSKNSKA
ncbi:unnamed protein product [Adineta steineri]|uniref:Cullin family profile domain-containing protein n=1 Tax=Adineta steineri TaxID=433720 RepID=A0A819GT29_9BILA|nr:unnamed protein product [Adineta steineri]